MPKYNLTWQKPCSDENLLIWVDELFWSFMAWISVFSKILLTLVVGLHIQILRLHFGIIFNISYNGGKKLEHIFKKALSKNML